MGEKAKMVIIDKEGSLATADEYEQIPIGPCSYNIGGLPYFPKVSKTREIICFTEGIRNRRNYRIGRNMLYTSGYAEKTIGDTRFHLKTSELEHVGRYFWNSAIETSTKDKHCARSSMGGNSG